MVDGAGGEDAVGVEEGQFALGRGPRVGVGVGVVGGWGGVQSVGLGGLGVRLLQLPHPTDLFAD